MERERTFGNASSAGQKALSTFLAVLLLAATILSVNHLLHQTLHSKSSANHHLCLLCSFASGQVHSAEVDVLFGILGFCLLTGVHPADVSLAAIGDYRLAPSRAPPVR